MAYTTHLDQGGPDNVVVVPISIKDNLYLKRNGGNLSISAGLLTYLIMYPDDKGGYQTEVATRIPDDSYFADSSIRKPYTGMVRVEDWPGNFIRAFHYTHGVADKVFGVSTSSTENGKVKASAFATQLCVTVDWFSCLSFTDGSPDQCTFLYEQTTCSDAGGSGGGIGGSGTINVYQKAYRPLQGGSGGTWNWAPNTGGLCQIYSFSVDGNGNYVANLNGLANGWVNSVQGEVDLTFPNTCITIASSGISRETASYRFNSAYNSGLNEIGTLLNNGSVTPDEANQEFIRLVASALALSTPGSSWDPSGNCSTTAPTNNYEVCQP